MRLKISTMPNGASAGLNGVHNVQRRQGARMTVYGQKTLDCLRLCALPIGSDERKALEAELCLRYSAKALTTTIVNHGDLFEWGVSAVYAWLTEKGKNALPHANGPR